MPRTRRVNKGCFVSTCCSESGAIALMMFRIAENSISSVSFLTEGVSMLVLTSTWQAMTGLRHATSAFTKALTVSAVATSDFGTLASTILPISTAFVAQPDQVWPVVLKRSRIYAGRSSTLTRSGLRSNQILHSSMKLVLLRIFIAKHLPHRSKTLHFKLPPSLQITPQHLTRPQRRKVRMVHQPVQPLISS